MTAVKEYQRLEASGLWRAAADAQRREVVIALGDATLTIKDLSDRVLAHWSLAAVSRSASRGAGPALFHPDGDPDETLEIEEDERDMLAALDRILRALDRSRPKPGKLRVWLRAVTGAAILAAAVFWLPGALLSYSVDVVPQVKRAEIGAALLDRITRVAGRPCAAPEATAPLRRLAVRVLGDGRRDALVVLPEGPRDTVHLPGGRILMNRALIEDYEDPDVPAGFVLVEAVRAASGDPLADILRHAGLMASLRLLTTGSLPDAALDAYAEHLLTVRRNGPVPPATLAGAFATAELRASPYAYALDLTGETTLPLIETDPRAEQGSRQVLSDPDWLRLQGICGG